MDSLKSLIQSKLSAKKPLAKQVQAALVVEKANEIVRQLWGEKMMKMAKAVSVRDGILKFHAINNMVCQELRFKQNSIVFQINAKFGLGTVRRLQVIHKNLEKLIEI